MFRFPKNEAQQETWLMNCGKLQNNIFFNYYILICTSNKIIGNTQLLTLDKSQLYNRYICQEHFGSDSFMNSEKKKIKTTFCTI